MGVKQREESVLCFQQAAAVSVLSVPLSLLCHCRPLIYFKNKLAYVEKNLYKCTGPYVFSCPLIPAEPPSQGQVKGAGGISARITL